MTNAIKETGNSDRECVCVRACMCGGGGGVLWGGAFLMVVKKDLSLRRGQFSQDWNDDNEVSW